MRSAYPAAALLVVAVVAETCVVALVRHALALAEGRLAATGVTALSANVC